MSAIESTLLGKMEEEPKKAASGSSLAFAGVILDVVYIVRW
jgi:hypothetical protein